MMTSEGFFERAMKFNVIQPFLMSQLAAQAMVDTAGSGSIVNVVTGKLLHVDGGTERPSVDAPVPPLRPSGGE